MLTVNIQDANPQLSKLVERVAQAEISIPDDFDQMEREGLAQLFSSAVGWVERSDTHHLDEFADCHSKNLM